MAEKAQKARKKAGLTVIPVGKTKRPEKRPARLAVGQKAKSALNIPLVDPLLGLAARKVRASRGARSLKRRKPTKPQANTFMVLRTLVVLATFIRLRW